MLISYTAILSINVIKCYIQIYCTGDPGGKVNILGGHSIGHCKKVYMNMCFQYLASSIFNLARNIFLPSHRNAPLSEACESV
jgi:hypothetical protein